MHHNVGPNDPERYRGLDREPKVGFIGFDPDSEREKEYLARLPEGTVLLSSASGCPTGRRLWEDELITDLFIAGSGEDAARAYAKLEPKLARSAAVNFVDGGLVAPVRSRHSHYVSRHQICGANVPWHMTNTSEPHSDDMVEQASNPVSFDCGWSRGFAGCGPCPK